jgi:hypothetical protein
MSIADGKECKENFSPLSSSIIQSIKSLASYPLEYTVSHIHTL